MQFLMLVCTDNQPVPDPVNPPDVEEWVSKNDEAGVRLIGNPIRPDADARAVRVRGGEVVVTDGPFIETKELLAGFDVLECADLDAAIKVAAGHPMAHFGVIELRPMISD